MLRVIAASIEKYTSSLFTWVLLLWVFVVSSEPVKKWVLITTDLNSRWSVSINSPLARSDWLTTGRFGEGLNVPVGVFSRFLSFPETLQCSSGLLGSWEKNFELE